MLFYTLDPIDLNSFFLLPTRKLNDSIGHLLFSPPLVNQFLGVERRQNLKHLTQLLIKPNVLKRTMIKNFPLTEIFNNEKENTIN